MRLKSLNAKEQEHRKGDSDNAEWRREETVLERSGSWQDGEVGFKAWRGAGIAAIDSARLVSFRVTWLSI